MRYIANGVPWSDEKIQLFVTDQIELYSERGFCRWKLVDKQSGGFVGFCGTGYWRTNPIRRSGGGLPVLRGAGD